MFKLHQLFIQSFHGIQYVFLFGQIIYNYQKVVSINMSHLEALFTNYGFFMKGKFNVYLL